MSLDKFRRKIRHHIRQRLETRPSGANRGRIKRDGSGREAQNAHSLVDTHPDVGRMRETRIECADKARERAERERIKREGAHVESRSGRYEK